MAIRDIVVLSKETEEVLHSKCRPVTVFDDKLAEFIDDLYDTLHATENGIGLAAPQVGVLRRVVVLDLGEDDYYELVNPEIVERIGTQTAIEGCLSLPNYENERTRPAYVRVRFQDRNGDWYEAEGRGLLARAFCHELDHLDGITIGDEDGYGDTTPIKRG